MIAISISMTVSVAGILFIIGQFNVQNQVQSMSDQLFDAQTAKDYLYSKTTTSTTSDVGLVSGGQVSSVSYAGDQMVIKDGEGNCYRVFWVQRLAELRAASETDGSCDQIAPVRGPNEQLPGGGYVQTDSTASDFDPVLDDLDGNNLNGYPSIVLAENVTQDSTSFGTDQSGFLLPIFSYSGDPDQHAYSVDMTADSGSTTAWYADPTDAENTQAIKLQFVIGSAPGAPGTTAAAREQQETIYLNS